MRMPLINSRLFNVEASLVGGDGVDGGPDERGGMTTLRVGPMAPLKLDDPELEIEGCVRLSGRVGPRLLRPMRLFCCYVGVSTSR